MLLESAASKAAVAAAPAPEDADVRVPAECARVEVHLRCHFGARRWRAGGVSGGGGGVAVALRRRGQTHPRMKKVSHAGQQCGGGNELCFVPAPPRPSASPRPAPLGNWYSS